MNIFFALSTCYFHILESLESHDYEDEDEDEDGMHIFYKQYGLYVSQKTEELWNMLWTNRALFHPRLDVPPLCPTDYKEGGYRGAVTSFLYAAYKCRERVLLYGVLSVTRIVKLSQSLCVRLQ